MDTPKADKSQAEALQTCPNAEKMKSAYIDERTKLEMTEVELNRSKIMMVDENGKMTKLNIVSEH